MPQRHLRKKAAVDLFRDSGADRLPDPAARRVAWCAHVDQLEREGLITARQAYRWTFPFA